MMNPTQEELRCVEELERMKQREKFIKFKQGGDNSQEKENIAQTINDLRAQNEDYFKSTYELIFPHKNPARQ